eukprot:31206_1
MIHEHTLDTDTKKSRLGALRRRIVGPPHDIHVARGQVCLLTCARRLLCHSHTERGERSVLAQSLCGETESIDIREEQSWDLASGNIRLTPTGHIHAVTGLYASDRHPYMFSVGCDKLIKCWDLEQNKTIRSCHTHLSGVYDVAILPNIDVIVTCGRDSVARVWDIRTKSAMHVDLHAVVSLYVDLHAVVSLYVDIHAVVSLYVDLHAVVSLYVDLHAVVSLYVDIHAVVSLY